MACRVTDTLPSYVHEQRVGHRIAESELATEPPPSGEIETVKVRLVIGAKTAVISKGAQGMVKLRGFALPG